MVKCFYILELLCLFHQAVQETGEKLMNESDIGVSDIKSRLDQLASSWAELKEMAANRSVFFLSKSS